MSWRGKSAWEQVVEHILTLFAAAVLVGNVGVKFGELIETGDVSEIGELVSKTLPGAKAGVNNHFRL